jgi:hypothetical protein
VVLFVVAEAEFLAVDFDPGMVGPEAYRDQIPIVLIEREQFIYVEVDVGPPASMHGGEERLKTSPTGWKKK